MNKPKRICLLTALLLTALFLGGCAAAEGGERVAVWKVTAGYISTDALVNAAFTDENGEMTAASGTGQEVDGVLDEYWEPAGQDGPPFCSVGPTAAELSGIQTHFSILRQRDDSPYIYLVSLESDNTIPEESGFTAERAEETVRAGEELLERLGLISDRWQAKPVYFATLGRMAGTAKSRKVLFEEVLDGLPIRWSADSLYDSRTGSWLADKCSVMMAFSDEEGLLEANGNWCNFEPLTYTDEILPEEEIAGIFAAAGYADSAPEACWFLHTEGKNATAVLAWRVGNGFVNAVDGSWLQAGR